MKEILLGILIFYIGVFVGFLLRVWLVRRSSYNGVINVIKDEKKTLYSLELDDNPKIIEFKKELILKVKTSEQNLDRE